MYTERKKDALALVYHTLNDEGKQQMKSVLFNNINDGVTNEILYEVSLLVKNLLAYSVNEILRRTEIIFLEN